jgi:signal transduction histidine kinase
LGLAICRGLVEANGGEIRLESATGQQTTFAVSFPLVAQPAEAR